MPSYRFCRPDDIPLLVQALNSCYVTHFPEEGEWDVPRFKRAVREESLWSSSCMIAFGPDGKVPVGVCFGCKRKEETLIYRVGVHPEHRGQGHASHVLTSLCSKLAVLGPPTMVVELAVEDESSRSFFEKLGYSAEREFCDFVLEEPLERIAEQDCIGELSFQEALDTEIINAPLGLAWCRGMEALENLADQIRVLGFASVEAMEALLLYREHDDYIEILNISSKDSSSHTMFAGVLLKHLSSQIQKKIFIPRLSSKELDLDLLKTLGFKPSQMFIRYSRQSEAN